MEALFLTIDQSTTSTKTQLFTPEEELVHSESRTHAQIYPQSNWIEHDPLEILSNTVLNIAKCLDAGLQKKYVDPQTRVLVGITNQRETLVAWSKSTGPPQHHAIVRHDARTEPK